MTLHRLSLALAVLVLLVVAPCLGEGKREQADRLWDQGIDLNEQGDTGAAIKAWEQALALYKAVPGSERNQADCGKSIGAALWQMGKCEEAISQEQQALQLYEAIKGTEKDRADCHRNIGLALNDLGRYEEAIARQDQALRIYQAVEGTERERANCQVGIGVSLASTGRHEEAMARWDGAVTAFRAIEGTERDRAMCSLNIGVVLDEMGRHEDAIARYDQALEVYQAIKGAEREQADCHTNIGVSLGRMFRSEEAIARQQQALQAYQAIEGTEREQAGCYLNTGAMLDDMGHFEEALARYNQALQLFQPIEGTERERATCHMNIGVALKALGRYEEAIARYSQALQAYEALEGTERNQAGCHTNIASALDELTRYDEAITRFDKALRLYQTAEGTEREQATCCANVGEVLQKKGRYEEAIARQRQALKLLETIPGAVREREACWGNVGHAERGRSRFSEAIAAYQQAGTHWWVSRGSADAYRRRGGPGDPEKALAAGLEAVRVAEESRASVRAFEHRAGILESRSRVFPALVTILVDWAARKAAPGEPEAARWARDPRSPTAALESAFHFADRGKGRALQDALRERAAVRSSRPDVKLVAEDRQLSQQIGKLAAKREELPPEDVEQRKKLTERIHALQQRREMIEVEIKRTALGAYVAPDFRKPMEIAADLPADAAVLQYSLSEEKEAWLLLMTREGISSHRLGADVPALPTLLPRQQATAGQLLQAWKAGPDGVGIEGLVRLARMRPEGLAAQGKEYSQVSAEQECAILERLGSVALPESALAALHKAKVTKLLVVPDGALHYVPFAMLRVPGDGGIHYVVEEFAVSYIPAMTTLETLRKQRQEREKKRKGDRRSLLAFANPDFAGGATQVAAATVADDMTTMSAARGEYYKGSGLSLAPLPDTEGEALRVGGLFGKVAHQSAPGDGLPRGDAVVCTGKGACEEQVKAALGGDDGARWRYLLFSTHGLVDTQNGMLSCVALSKPRADAQEDGFLQGQEVMNLQLDADLVMLSACQTGLGKMRGGEGLVGLSAAFFYAGADSVCASLWSVPSGPTNHLTTEFFTRLKEGKVDKAEALRQAQLAVLRSGRNPQGQTADYSSPFCWGAFVLVGDPQ